MAPVMCRQHFYTMCGLIALVAIVAFASLRGGDATIEPPAKQTVSNAELVAM